jgi:hypothetical protein
VIEDAGGASVRRHLNVDADRYDVHGITDARARGHFAASTDEDRYFPLEAELSAKAPRRRALDVTEVTSGARTA